MLMVWALHPRSGLVPGSVVSGRRPVDKAKSVIIPLSSTGNLCFVTVQRGRLRFSDDWRVGCMLLKDNL